MKEITNEQEIPLHIAPRDKHGNIARVDGQPQWSVSDAAVIELLPGADAFDKIARPRGPIGAAIVTCTVDADLGEGVKPLTGTFAIAVLSGEASTLAISAGDPAPVPQPVTDPVAEEVVPVADPVTDPVAEAVTDAPAADPATEEAPATETIAEASATETEAVAETQPEAQADAPVADPIVDPVVTETEVAPAPAEAVTEEVAPTEATAETQPEGGEQPAG